GAESGCAFGVPFTTTSPRLSFVSWRLPPAPPGLRSMLDPAAGAGAADPSTKAFAASPQPIASMGVPPTGRSTSAPPVVANPPEYVASAPLANTPELLAMSTCRPGATSSDEAHVAFLVTVDPL